MILLLLAIIIFGKTEFVHATGNLQVEKLIENKNISVGDNVTILLRFTNPFGRKIPIKIVDKNIFGNNGLNIQCLEYTLPSKKQTVIAYEPIKPYKPGKYVLDSAEVSYVNPETNKKETVNSNKVNVNVLGTGTQQGQAQGITSIYRCNGINMQSTSYSSTGGSMNVQIGGSSIPNQQTQNAQNRVQNNQMNQNANAIKQQMEQQLQKQRQMEQQFQKNLASNKEFQKYHQKLLKQGYNLTNVSYNAITNNTGSFKLIYQKQNNETATMSGNMNKGVLENVSVLTSKDKEKMLKLLEKNKKFQKYNKELIKQGFNRSQPVFNQLSQNHTQITFSYKKNNETENKIIADYVNETIQKVSLENNQQKNKKDFLWWSLLLFLIPVAFYVVHLLSRKSREKKSKKVVKRSVLVEKPFDYVAEARKLLQRAKKLFSEKKEKDAYEKTSQAIRLYFSYFYGIKKDLTNSELLKYLMKNEKDKYSDVKKCLDLCALVEFAKYQPNIKDFNKIISLAEKIIPEK